MNLTDFMGREFGPGDLVYYAAMSGRCPNIILGRVVDIYMVYRDPDKYKWAKLTEGDPVPHKFNWKDEDMGEVETELRVTVQPLKGARWEQHHARSYWIDERDGHRIDPTRSAKYVAVPQHFVFADGTRYDYEAAMESWIARYGKSCGTRERAEADFERAFRQTYRVNYGEPGTFRWAGDEQAAPGKHNLWWVRDQYHPWVKEVKADAPKPVTLIITGNIVKVEGELPDGEVPVPVQ